jgi:uncharacterized membrane protein YfcA
MFPDNNKTIYLFKSYYDILFIIYIVIIENLYFNRLLWIKHIIDVNITPAVIDDYLNTILLLITGGLSGLYVGIASGTAQAFIIPILTIIIGSSVYNAIGTSLFIDSLIGLVAGLIFFKKGKVKFQPVLILAISGVIAAFIGTNFTTGAPESVLKGLIAIVLIVFGINLLKNGVKKNVEYIERKINFSWFKNNQTITLIIFGIFIGFASGFTGMGSSGAVTLILIFILGYDLHTAIGTSLLMMFFITGSGAIGHGLIGNFIFDAALIAGLAAMIGAASGSLFANRIDEDKLGRLIGGILLIIGVVLFVYLFI